MLVYSKGNPKEILSNDPTLDRDATIALVSQLFPAEKLTPLGDGDLSNTYPPNDEILVGCYQGLVVIAAKECSIDFPSKLPNRFIEAFADGTLYLHAMHSVSDWLGFGVWRNAILVRSLSLAPDSPIVEDIGARLPFEAPYWAGDHPAFDPCDIDAVYPFDFHPCELGEAALLDFFGYQLEGIDDPSHLAPERIPLMRFKRNKVRWWNR